MLAVAFQMFVFRDVFLLVKHALVENVMPVFRMEPVASSALCGVMLRGVACLVGSCWKADLKPSTHHPPLGLRPHHTPSLAEIHGLVS